MLLFRMHQQRPSLDTTTTTKESVLALANRSRQREWDGLRTKRPQLQSNLRGRTTAPQRWQIALVWPLRSQLETRQVWILPKQTTSKMPTWWKWSTPETGTLSLAT